MIKVTVWNEYIHEKCEEKVSKIYPEGIHNAIAEFLKCDDIEVKTSTLEDADCGLSDEILKNTDVLIWWGHMGHDRVDDAVVARVHRQVLNGMGMIFLHSAHHSKLFKALMGTTCNLSWREDDDWEKIWVCNPSHPIAAGIERYFELPAEETYCEPFGIPEPDELVFIGSYEGGEVFRSGCCYKKEYGKVFYFQPGHETYPTFYDKNVQTIIRNAVYWAKPTYRVENIECPHIDKIER